MKSKEHCDSTISCSALLLISGRKIKMYYQKCRKNDHLDINGIKEYGNALPQDMINAFKGVEGRLKEIRFIIQVEKRVS